MMQARMTTSRVWPWLCVFFLAQTLALQESYWDLAEQTCGPAVYKAIQLLPTILTKDSGPGDVKQLRFALLEARELLDIFSFAFSLPTRTSDDMGAWEADASNQPELARAKDIWLKLRHDLDEGYEVIGDFQDLAHSLVEYNATDAAQKLAVCLEWQSRFLANDQAWNYVQYAASPSHGTLYRHTHMSKLFWGYKHHLPQYNKTGLQNLGVMVRDCQLAQLNDNYTRLLSLETIWEEPEHGQFHLFRKLIRSVIGVLQFFPQLVPQPQQGLTPSSHRHADDSPPPAAAALPLGSSGSSSRGASVLGQARSAHQRKLAAAVQPQAQTVAANGQAARQGDNECRPWEVYDVLAKVKLGLGDINDKIYAWDFYLTHGNQTAAEEAKQCVQAQWKQLRRGMRECQFDRQVMCLAGALPR
mmetsp:Transcript_9653/g.23968  ORF Transcript_9653/g.23968 Transcript_9653/m.23968 type:complete len:415 (-) Transcript_9653:442-1686(-)